MVWVRWLAQTCRNSQDVRAVKQVLTLWQREMETRGAGRLIRMQESPYRATVAGIGILGGLFAGIAMVLGPLIASPSPPWYVQVLAIGYPLLLFGTAFVGMKSMFGAFVLSLVAIGCVAVLAVGVFDDESWMTRLWILAILGSPAIAQAITARAGMKVE